MATEAKHEKHFENTCYNNLLAARETQNELWPEPQTTQFYRALVQGAERITGSILGTRQPELAREIATRTCLNLHRFDGRSRFSTWFYRIASNEANEWLRRKQQRRETSIEAVQEPSAPPVEPQVVPRVLDGREKALAQLLLEGYTHEEAAKVLGISKRRVLYEWTLLRKRLKSPKKLSNT